MGTTQEMVNYQYQLPGTVPASFWYPAIEVANKKKVDPYLLAAIANHETGYGQLGAGKQGFALGYGYYAPGVYEPKYQDDPGEFTNQLNSAAAQISSWFQGKPVTEENLKLFMEESWKPGDKNWYKGIWNSYQEIVSGQANWNYDTSQYTDNYNPDLQVPGGVGITFDGLKSIPEKITYVVVVVVIGLLGFYSLTKVFK